MAFDVLITDKAFADLDAITGFIRGEATIDIARRDAGAMPFGSRSGRTWELGSASLPRQEVPGVQDLLQDSPEDGIIRFRRGVSYPPLGEEASHH